MYKTLLKKQLLEMNTFYFIDRKTGKKRTKGKIIAFFILFVFLFLSISFAFFGISDAMYSVLSKPSKVWAYYSIMGLMAVFLGTFGSVFNTYAGLFKSTDNDLMLSLPVKPVAIIITRMLGVYFMSLLYSFIVWLPTLIRRFINPPISVLEIIIVVLMIFIIPLLVTIFTCILGWIVALISSRIKNKTLVSTVLYVIIFGTYYYVNIKSRALIAKAIQNIDKISATVKTWIYPMYLFGKACSGNLAILVLFLAFVFIVFTLFLFIMSKTFFKIIVSAKSNSNSKKTEVKIRKSSLKRSLLKKEYKKFTSSTTYFLNAGLGVILIIAASIFAIIKKDMIMNYVSIVLTQFRINDHIIIVILSALIGMLLSMDSITAPSISLEANNLWLLKSTPLRVRDIFESKINLSISFNMIGALISSLLLSIALDVGIIGFLFILFYVISVITFFAYLGLILGLKYPILSWTNETVPVKQSLSVVICVFGGMLINILFGGIYVVLMLKRCEVIPEVYTMIFSILMLLFTIIMRYWLNKRGVEIFEKL